MKQRKGYIKAQSIVLKSGIKEGGKQVNISHQGLITLGSGLIKDLAVDMEKDEYWVQLYSTPDNTDLTIDILTEPTDGDHKWRKGGKVNCKPMLRDIPLDWVQDLINQETDKSGVLTDANGISSVTCNDTTLSTDGEIVIDVKAPEVFNRKIIKEKK